MKLLSIVLFVISSVAYGQLTIADTQTASSKYEIGSYSYHQQFTGHPGYAAPVVLTTDGGAVVFGDYKGKDGKGGLLLKLNKDGKEEWKRFIKAQYDEIESQSVIQDNKGNFYIFMISYDYKKYRGGSERVVYIDKAGKVLWDKTIGSYNLVNNPNLSYIHLLKDGRLELRGHIVTEKPDKGADPKYHYWEGWITNQGKLTQQSGEVIDWSNKDWQNKFKPE